MNSSKLNKPFDQQWGKNTELLTLEGYFLYLLMFWIVSDHETTKPSGRSTLF